MTFHYIVDHERTNCCDDNTLFLHSILCSSSAGIHPVVQIVIDGVKGQVDLLASGGGDYIITVNPLDSIHFEVGGAGDVYRVAHHYGCVSSNLQTWANSKDSPHIQLQL